MHPVVHATHRILYPSILGHGGEALLIIGVLMLFGLGDVLQGLGNMGRPQEHPHYVNVRRVSNATAIFAVVFYVLYKSGVQLRSEGGGLIQFFMDLPSGVMFPRTVWWSLGALAFMTAVASFQWLTGHKGPFPPRDNGKIGWCLISLMVWGGLWFFGAFVEDDFFDIGVSINVGLTCLYLYSVVAAVTEIEMLWRGERASGEKLGDIWKEWKKSMAESMVNFGQAMEQWGTEKQRRRDARGRSKADQVSRKEAMGAARRQMNDPRNRPR
jgi:hypothetical protein